MVLKSNESLISEEIPTYLSKKMTFFTKALNEIQTRSNDKEKITATF